MAIYSELSHEKWWFSIAFCMFTRGYTSCAKHCQSHLIIVHVVRRTIRISTSNGKITRSHIGASGSFKSSQRCRISYIYIWLYICIYLYLFVYICLLYVYIWYAVLWRGVVPDDPSWAQPLLLMDQPTLLHWWALGFVQTMIFPYLLNIYGKIIVW